MSHRTTSIEAFHAAQASGLIAGKRWLVYEHLFQNGPLTAKQIDLALKKSTQNSGVFTTRLSELRDQGVVTEIGKVVCKYTGHRVILWDTTNKYPKKREVKKKQPCLFCAGKGYT